MIKYYLFIGLLVLCIYLGYSVIHQLFAIFVVEMLFVEMFELLLSVLSCFVCLIRLLCCCCPVDVSMPHVEG